MGNLYEIVLTRLATQVAVRCYGKQIMVALFLPLRLKHFHWIFGADKDLLGGGIEISLPNLET